MRSEVNRSTVSARSVCATTSVYVPTAARYSATTCCLAPRAATARDSRSVSAAIALATFIADV
eukprot:1813493-Pleurochrysis_carterae.AAC.2